MLYLKAQTTDGKTEYLNAQHILNITKHENGNFKILMGAALYWVVRADTIEFVELEDIFNKE
jgi:hypothetical protein